MENQQVAVRRRNGEDQGAMSLERLIERLNAEIASYFSEKS
jgi:threonyl-tRNA synthetase